MKKFWTLTGDVKTIFKLQEFPILTKESNDFKLKVIESLLVARDKLVLNPNMSGEERGVKLTPPCGFLKNVSSIERLEPWFFVTFNIILKDIFPENFIKFPQVVEKIWRNSLSILAIFINFP